MLDADWVVDSDWNEEDFYRQCDDLPALPNLHTLQIQNCSEGSFVLPIMAKCRALRTLLLDDCEKGQMMRNPRVWYASTVEKVINVNSRIMTGDGVLEMFGLMPCLRELVQVD